MGGTHFPGDDVAHDVTVDGGADRRDVGKMEHGLGSIPFRSSRGSNSLDSVRIAPSYPGVRARSLLRFRSFAWSDGFLVSCEHYRRRCKIVAPCCKEVFPCRHCHNEATALGDRHNICRQDVEKVVCLLCDTEQPVSQVCISCGVNMGEYFCDVCKFYDDDTEKGQYHCHDCGICRVGGKENYFHCAKCGSCYAVALRDNHQCVEDSMRQNCPICYEYLFDSLKGTRVLDCGHTMHMECFSEMVEHNKYTCPICSRTALDMTHTWGMLDQEIEATIMPPVYRYKVWVLCNDCIKVSEVDFHVIGHKCSHCNSYNTRSTSRPADLSGSSSPSTTDSSENNL